MTDNRKDNTTVGGEPLYYRTPYTDDEAVPAVPDDCTVAHLPTVTTPQGGQKATCHCDFDMIDPRCVVKKDVIGNERKGGTMTDENSEVRELRWRIKQLGKQNGRQGETIHRLRGELAEMREMNGRIQRGELRELDRLVAALIVTRQYHVDTIMALREKLDGETSGLGQGFGSAYSGGSDV